eukprot:Opistho-2@59012
MQRRDGNGCTAFAFLFVRCVTLSHSPEVHFAFVYLCVMGRWRKHLYGLCVCILCPFHYSILCEPACERVVAQCKRCVVVCDVEPYPLKEVAVAALCEHEAGRPQPSARSGKLRCRGGRQALQPAYGHVARGNLAKRGLFHARRSKLCKKSAHEQALVEGCVAQGNHCRRRKHFCKSRLDVGDCDGPRDPVTRPVLVGVLVSVLVSARLPTPVATLLIVPGTPSATGNLRCTPAYVKRTPSIPTNTRNLPRTKFNGGQIKGVEAHQTRRNNFLKLLIRVWLKRNASRAETTGDAVSQEALGKIHCVGDGNNHKARVGAIRPVEEVVKNILSAGHQKIQLVEQEHDALATWRGC